MIRSFLQNRLPLYLASIVSTDSHFLGFGHPWCLQFPFFPGYLQQDQTWKGGLELENRVRYKLLGPFSDKRILNPILLIINPLTYGVWR